MKRYKKHCSYVASSSASTYAASCKVRADVGRQLAVYEEMNYVGQRQVIRIQQHARLLMFHNPQVQRFYREAFATRTSAGASCWCNLLIEGLPKKTLICNRYCAFCSVFTNGSCSDAMRRCVIWLKDSKRSSLEDQAI